MGLFDRFTAAKPIDNIVDASLAPVNSLDSIGAPYFGGIQSASRSEAMGVPVIARARGIICSTVATAIGDKEQIHKRDSLISSRDQSA